MHFRAMYNGFSRKDTQRVGDVVTIKSERIGTLSNTVTTSRDAPAWTMGIGEFVRNLAGRGLVDRL